MYNHIRHLPDIRYDVMSWATTVGNALPVVAFPLHNWQTVVFTGPYPGPRGPWQLVHRSFWCKKVMASLSPWHIVIHYLFMNSIFYGSFWCNDMLWSKKVLQTEKCAAHKRNFAEKMPFYKVAQKSCFSTTGKPHFLCFLGQSSTTFCCWKGCWYFLLFLYYTENKRKYHACAKFLKVDNSGV